MSKEKITQHYGFLPSDSEGINSLAELALDLSWSWNHATDELWELLDADMWQLTHNPWIVLQTVSRDKLERQLADTSFQQKMKELLTAKELAAADDSWFQKKYSATTLRTVAYFSMEFMLSEALPIYVGGLGNVAGDQLKSASDLGVPVVAVGLLYQQGYFRQEIDKYGNQQALFPYNDPGQLPITPLRLPNGEWLRLKIFLSGYPVWLRTWQVQVGRLKLYLLDTNDASNLPIHRGITDELYGGGADMRIKQEFILGIGGYKLLEALDIRPQVCHMNEGHAAFMILERANQFMKENETSFETALAVTRAGNLFTTHTAVAAGFDHFSLDLIEQFLGAYAKDELNISFKELMSLGRQNPYNNSESFNMAFLAIRGSGAVNCVSRLHGVVSRHLFESLFPRWPKEEIPISHVTNGVHMPSWDSELADSVWTEACGKGRWRGDLETMEPNICKVSDQTLWELRNISRNNLVKYARMKLERQFHVAGQPPEMLEMAKHIFDPHTLTLGFARRFVAYKRPNLLLHDEERFIRILTNPEHPVQLVIAGKAPPFDESGKDLIRQWAQFIQQHNLYNHVAFLSDHDMLLAEQMVQGADVWVNTPRRPWEACGTSGMKVLVNGGINLSELDGWWAEAYKPELGWALGDEQEHGEDPAWDAIEADALYSLLENQVVPEFYARNQHGMPERWLQRIRQSMALLTPRFSANRTVREYTESHYLPAAENYVKRANEKGAAGSRIITTMHTLREKWDGISIGEQQTNPVEGGYLINIQIGLHDIDPALVQVELYAEKTAHSAIERIAMKCLTTINNGKELIYQALVITTRSAGDYSARIIPKYEDVSVPLEDNLIRWQR